MKRFTVILWTLFVVSAAAQAPDTLWTRTYGGSYSEHCFLAQQTTDGGYIIIGETQSFGAGSVDVWLIKTDADGNALWTQTYGGTGEDASRSGQQTTDGGFIIAGSTPGANGLPDVLLIKTDSLGDTLWTKTYGGSQPDVSYSVQQTSDEGYIVGGSTWSFGAGGQDIYLIKTDSLGDTLWTKTYGGFLEELSLSVQQTPDGGYIITGQTNSFGAGSFDVWLLRTDSHGDTLWTETYGGFNYDYGMSVALTSNGGYIMAGRTASFGAGYSDVWLLKTDSLGDTLWTRTYGGWYTDGGCSVQQTADGGYVIAGFTYSFGAGSSDAYLVKTDANGDTLWTKTYGGWTYDFASAVQQTSDHGYIVAGYTSSFGVGAADIWLIKIAPDTFGIKEQQESRIRSHPIFDISPNPFRNKTRIYFNLPSSNVAFLSIYDICGRLVDRQVIHTLQSSGCSLVWPEANKKIASGVYLCILDYKGFKYLSKMIKN